jgi:hypothetical protein
MTPLPFIPYSQKCTSGVIKHGKVPAITYCQLKFDPPTQNLSGLGHYANGFWTQPNGTVSLPFMAQSFEGTYVSPGFIKLGQSIVAFQPTLQ